MRENTRLFFKVETVVLIPLLRCIVMSWDSALQHINTILHCSKMIVKLFWQIWFFFFFKTSLCKSLWKDRHLKRGHKPHEGLYNSTTNPSLLFILNSHPLLENATGCFCGRSTLPYLRFEVHRDVICPQGDLDITSKPKVPPVLGEETSGSDADKFSAGWRLAPYCLPSHSCSLLNGFVSFHHFSFVPSQCLCLPQHFCLLPLRHLGPSSALRWAEDFRYSWSVNFTVQTKS